LIVLIVSDRRRPDQVSRSEKVEGLIPSLMLAKSILYEVTGYS
jgi:hypothetical protein